jgi:hypothetical protein
VKHSYPLNYEPICTAFGIEPKTNNHYFPLRKKGDCVCCHYTKPYLLTPGPEPCSFRSQRNALPVKLEPTFVIGAGFEPTPPGSEPGTLPLHYPTVLRFVRELNPWRQIDNLQCFRYNNEPCNLYEIQTHHSGSKTQRTVPLY